MPSPLDAIVHELVSPPHPGLGVCSICRSVSYERADEHCENCRDNESVLGPSTPLTAISLYIRESKLRNWLTYYKDSSDESHGGEHVADQEASETISLILDEFFRHRGSQLLTEASVDAIVVVPSTVRPPPHPLEVVLRVASLSGVEISRPLIRTGAEVRHRFANRDAFKATEDVSGRRLLLLDDVYTTGSYAQSASYALRAAGAEVTSLVAIGRRVNPDYSEEARFLWERQQKLHYIWN